MEGKREEGGRVGRRKGGQEGKRLEGGREGERVVRRRRLEGGRKGREGKKEGEGQA